MKTSELIAQLQALVATHGDLPVYANDEEYPDYEVDEATFEPAWTDRVAFVEYPTRFLLA